jgi:glycosyltransferase involved in cell wall biosynthesis
MTVPTKTLPLVSVVAAVYNGRRYLRQSVQSVLSQEGVELEFVVVDDGSTDGSGDVLAELAAADPRLRVLRQENQGLTRALIRGCAEARGELIARHDADDLSLPARLRRQAERLAGDAELSMVSCSAEAIGPEDEPLYLSQRSEDSPDLRDFDFRSWQAPPAHGTVMFRRSAYRRAGGYREEFYFAQDMDLWLRMNEIGHVAFLRDVLYAYRVSESCISNRHRPLQRELARLVHACHEARRQAQSEAPLLQAARTMRPGQQGPQGADPTGGAYFIGRCLLRRGDRRARRYFRRVLVQRPLHLRAWVSLAASYLPRPAAAHETSRVAAGACTLQS